MMRSNEKKKNHQNPPTNKEHGGENHQYDILKVILRIAPKKRKEPGPSDKISELTTKCLQSL